MNKIDSAIREIHIIDEMASKDQWMNHVHPLVKFILTIYYLILLISLQKYDWMGIIGMGLCLFVLFALGDVSLKDGIRRLRLILPFLCIVGVFNPFFDRQVMMTVGGLQITGGILSMLTLIGKGVLSVFLAYLLIVTTGIVKVCRAMQSLHIPSIIVTTILFIYRYLTLLLEEAGRISAAYALRAPGQKGIHHKYWGALTGQLLLRSMDRGQQVYESMCLRGFRGEYRDSARIPVQFSDVLFLLCSVIAITVFRFLPVFELVGNLFI